MSNTGWFSGRFALPSWQKGTPLGFAQDRLGTEDTKSAVSRSFRELADKYTGAYNSTFTYV